MDIHRKVELAKQAADMIVMADDRPADEVFTAAKALVTHIEKGMKDATARRKAAIARAESELNTAAEAS